MDRYPKEFTLEFIELYRSLPSIWDTSSEEYRCFRQKAEDYEVLIQKWKEIEPEADRNFVVKKINLLRTKHRRDLKRVARGFKPSNWAYEHLTFLSNGAESMTETNFSENTNLKWEDNADSDVDILEQRDDPLDVDIADITSQKIITSTAKEPRKLQNCTSIDHTDFRFTVTENGNINQHDNPFDTDDITSKKIYTSTAKKVRKVQNNSAYSAVDQTDFRSTATENGSANQQDAFVSKVVKLLERKQDEMDRFDHISKTWALTLRSVQSEQRVIAEKLISDILYSAQMGNLNLKTPLEVSRFLHKIP